MGAAARGSPTTRPRRRNPVRPRAVLRPPAAGEVGIADRALRGGIWLFPLSLRERAGVRADGWRASRWMKDLRRTNPHPIPLPKGEGTRAQHETRLLHQRLHAL